MGELILPFLLVVSLAGIVSCLLLLALLLRGRRREQIQGFLDSQQAAEAVIDDLRDRLLEAQRELAVAKFRSPGPEREPRAAYADASFSASSDDGSEAELRQRLAAAEDALARMRNALDLADARASAAEQQLRRAEQRPAAAAPSGGDRRFTDAKRAFARLYHPNSSTGTGIEKVVRAEIFKEFWAELERIEAQQ